MDPLHQQQHASSSSGYDEASHATAGGGGGDAGFFERERNRLIQDISKGVESILTQSNALNRKVEESISVGKEFHPISELWSKFERVMVASGIPNLHPQAVAAGVGGGASGVVSGVAAVGGGGEEKENVVVSGAGVTPRKPAAAGEEEEEGLRFELGAAARSAALPPGVAPGGGRIYA